MNIGDVVPLQLEGHTGLYEIVEVFGSEFLHFVLVFPRLEDLQDQQEASASIMVVEQGFGPNDECLREPMGWERRQAMTYLVEMGLVEPEDVADTDTTA